jgi:methylmalonyl-CoA/ethylmalonyl-CoA epimerase
VKSVAHIGVAVKDLSAAARVFALILGREPNEIEEVGNQKVRLASFDVGETQIELLEAASPDSPIAKFIEKRGAGIHHICLQVHDLQTEIDRLRKAGLRFIDEYPRTGADGTQIAFIHPASTAGILIELQQA